MNKEDLEKVKEIRRILGDLHKRWSEDPNQDGHCKSNEGYVGVTYCFPNWFEAEDYVNDKPTVIVEVYSYLFGPSRLHTYYSFEEALEAVKSWQY